jgi:hypothetical protein
VTFESVSTAEGSSDAVKRTTSSLSDKVSNLFGRRDSKNTTTSIPSEGESTWSSGTDYITTSQETSSFADEAVEDHPAKKSAASHHHHADHTLQFTWMFEFKLPIEDDDMDAIALGEQRVFEEKLKKREMDAADLLDHVFKGFLAKDSIKGSLAHRIMQKELKFKHGKHGRVASDNHRSSTTRKVQQVQQGA